jgi:S1-C subfamily serine protease
VIRSFLAGALGGAVVLLVAVVAVGGTGIGSSSKTVVMEPALSAPGTSGSPRAPSAQAIYERDAPGVVFVSAAGVSVPPGAGEYLKGEASPEGAATGSGFEVDGAGTILTNWHVVDGATSVTVGLDHGKTVAARVVGKSPSDDLAVLRIPTAGLTLHPLALGRSGQAKVGDPVLAIGNPFGLERTLTTGVVSAVGRRIRAPNGLTIAGALQTDAPINPGNSGGPLLNERGAVIGIASQIETASSQGGSVGIAFAIPIDVVRRELARLPGA